MDPLAVAHEQMLGLETPERARRPEPQHGVEAGGLCARPEEGDRPERVPDERGSAARATRAPPRATSGSGRPGAARTASREARAARRDAGRRAAGRRRRSRGCAGRAAGRPRRAPRAPGRGRRARASRRRRRARRGRRPRARARCAPSAPPRSSRWPARSRRRSSRALQLRERLLEHLVGLRSEHEQPPVEHERRHGIRAHRVRLAGRRLDPVSIAIAGEDVLDLVGGQPGRGGLRAQDSGSPMFFASAQYASISRSCMSACRPRSRASSVSRRAFIEFGTTSGLGLYSSPRSAKKPVIRSVIGLAAVAGEQLLARDPLRRVLGMEIERQPAHVGAKLALELRGRRLARAAERSDVVAPDLDGVLVHGLRLPRRRAHEATAAGRDERLRGREQHAVDHVHDPIRRGHVGLGHLRAVDPHGLARDADASPSGRRGSSPSAASRPCAAVTFPATTW